MNLVLNMFSMQVRTNNELIVYDKYIINKNIYVQFMHLESVRYKCCWQSKLALFSLVFVYL